MKSYLLPSDKIFDFVEKLAEDGSVFYPVCEDKTAHLIRFNTIQKFSPDFKKIRAAENIKHFLFPSRDVVATFPDNKNKKTEQQYLFGVKNCDIRGVDVYDRVFTKWEPLDPFYKEKRDNTILISADCPEPEDCCFCTLVGLNPYAEGISDINFTQVSSGFLFETFTKRGEVLIDKFQDIFKEVNKDDEKERDKIRNEAIKKLNKINEKPFIEDLSALVAKADNKAIRDSRDECVECFACLHVCPTCYCFLLSDYQKINNVARVRTWDACYYAAYARVGGGANPRGKMDERFWNRFQCKFNYFYQYEKIFACSGCGRCYRGCSAQIDIRKILWKV